MIRRAVLGIVLASLLSVGCGKSRTADEWIKARLSPATPADRILQMESEHADVRREALLYVQRKPDMHRVPSVIKLVCLLAREDYEKEPMVRATAARTLGEMKGEDVVPTLGAVLTTDPNPFVRADAAWALGRQGSPDGIQALAHAIRQDKSVDVRVASAEALHGVKDKRAAETLLAGLADPDVAVARKSWESLRYLTGQDLPFSVEPWSEWLASAEQPFARYGRPPPIPKGASQRPQLTQGIGSFIKGLFKRNVREAELE